MKTCNGKLVSPIWSTLLVSAVMLVALPLQSGCNVLGVMAYKFAGPTKVKPQYKLPEVPTLVIAESFSTANRSTINSDRLARVVTTSLSQHLSKNPNLLIVSQDELDKLRSSRLADYSKMSTAAIARAVGAKQVVYIDLQEVAVSGMAGSQVFKGMASAYVRVIDAQTQKVLWPDGSEQGSPVAFESSPLGKSSKTRNATLAATIDGLGDRTAKLFYEWQPESENLPQD